MLKKDVAVGSFHNELQATWKELTASCKTLAGFLAKKRRRGLRMLHRGNTHVRCFRGEPLPLAFRCAPCDWSTRGGRPRRKLAVVTVLIPPQEVSPLVAPPKD